MEGIYKKQKHIVLIHGACHGAWCWYKVMTQLRSQGHHVTALDMAAAGANTKPLAEVTTFSDYSRPLMEFMEALPEEERVVLVGHSMGGINISLAMEKYPNKIDVAVFVTAFMPGPNLNVHAIRQEHDRQMETFLDSQVSFSNGEDKPPTSFLFGPKFLSTHLYQLSPPEDLTLAISLVRPIGRYQDAPDLLEETRLSEEYYGSVRRVYVVCEQDYVLRKEYQEWMIENNPTDEVKMIRDADHMVMFSKPQELCLCLQQIMGN
ncbi:methyl jasmonate esterase 1-like [Henckelia pumila]|uniref:methyl jasmonate esterase 1-like n=1 Tax=Henckelia pumila TaxID=405737 RepID=UPI003C6DBFBF